MKRLIRAVLVLVGLAGCTPPVQCIARGARVRVPGGTRRIEELAVGDEIVCVDPITGEEHVGRLSAVTTAERECVRLGALTCTSDHPVWSPEGRGYFPAGDWALGTRAALSNGPVAAVERYAGIHQVFDLTVDHPLHNFVADGVLVHNKSPPCNTAPDGAVPGNSCTCSDGGTGEFWCNSSSVVDGCSCER